MQRKILGKKVVSCSDIISFIPRSTAIPVLAAVRVLFKQCWYSKRHQVVSLTAFFWTSDKQHHAQSFFSVYFFKQQRRRLRRTIPAWPLRSWYSPWLRIRGCWNSPSWASWLPPAGPKFWPTRLLGARWVRGRPGPGPEKESEVDWLRFWTISSSGGVKHFCFPGSGINSRRSPTFFFKKTIKLMDVELV